MKIGEIAERLIRLRDNATFTRSEDNAVCAACNILDKMNSAMSEDDAKDFLLHIDAERKERNAMQETLNDATATLLRIQGASGAYADSEITAFFERANGRGGEEGRRYRTRKELVDYFRWLQHSFEWDAHRDNDNPVLYAKAEAYRLAAFEVQHNTREGEEWNQS